MGASNDGSEDVDQFLARIASLSKKSEDDAEQTRRAEEQMMQARKERQARRAGMRIHRLSHEAKLTTHTERARSISPVKTGPAAPLSSTSPRPTAERSIEPPMSLTPRSRAQTTTRPDESPTRPSRPLPAPSREHERPLPQPPSETVDIPASAQSTSRPLSRSGTLSWQQRPLSRGIGSVRSRPLSASRGASAEPPSGPGQAQQKDTDDAPSRKDIAATLGSKDPAWFRQTQERGLGSAAYRKSEHDDTSFSKSSSHGMKLPGLSAEINSSRSAQDMQPPRSPNPTATEDAAIKQSPTSQSPRRINAAAAYVSNPGPAPAMSPTEPPSMLQPTSGDLSVQDLDGGLGRAPSLLSSGGRPPSPTKGLGGFVQSAMMRRSDSVSKRWSVQANAGLKRGDSVAGNRPSFNAPTTAVPPLGHARTLSREPRNTRDGTSSPLSGSRPTSSHAEEHTQKTIQKSKSEPQGLVAPQSNRASVAAQVPASDGQEDSILSRSPSKTMDPRRWSPTKASWLESALARPESPRFSPSKEEPPAWKIGLQRSKSQKELAIPDEKPATSQPDTAVVSAQEAKSTDPLKPPGYLKATDYMRNAEKPAPESQEPSSKTDDVPKHSPPSRTAFATSKPENPDAPRPTRDELDQPISTPNFRASIDKKPPVLKPKPQTPPKTDFRANLRSRDNGPASAASDEPEFKTVFGKLKKAETKNYVAPDTLKDNISRGKAALNLTGGPQPRKRVDEFKESILAQKDAMKAGGGSIHKKSPSRDASPEKPAPDVPEALRRRNTLHKSKASVEGPIVAGLHKASDTGLKSSNKAPEVSNAGSKEATPVAPPQPPFKKPAEKPGSMSADRASEQPQPRALGKFDKSADSVEDGLSKVVSVTTPRDIPAKIVESSISHSSSHDSDKKSTVEQESERVLSRTSTIASDTSARSLPVSGQASPAIGGIPHQKKAAGGGLASRLNPALAGLIARGNSPKPASDETATEGYPPSTTALSKNALRSKVEDPANLTHMTKARAKGPKRRAPKTEAVPSPKETPKSDTSKVILPAETKREPIASASPTRNPVKTSFADVRSAFDTKPAPKMDEAGPATEQQPPRDSFASRSEAKSPPPVQIKSPGLRSVSGQSPSLASKSTPPPVVASKSSDLRRVSSQSPAPDRTDPAPPKPPAKKTFDIAVDRTSKDAESPKPVAPMPLTPSRSKLNSSRPQKSSDDATESLLATKTKTSGLGVSLAGAPTPTKTSQLTPPPENVHRASAPTESRKVSENASPVRRALETYFSSVPRSDETADFDTEAILKAVSPVAEGVKTLNCQVFEVSGDGKKNAVPAGQEHVLFEECMYLVIHNFELAGKKAAEAYLWTGDAVAGSAIDDAQLFCRKIARENSAKMDVIKQGKESSNFFSALGGILITRRAKNSALYMLRGQRHVGHVAFDEVELSAESLCSGFPYLISAKFGKLYLWKGQGCGADEVGAARLIGMDIGLTGEIEEVLEGKEPTAFWECFTGPNPKAAFKASEIWAMRSMDEKKGFPCKLYRLEAERPKSSGGFWGLRATSPSKPTNKATLTEIAPFTQQDLEKDSVHVLDAWASVYV